jgi:hypothetical protein
MKSLIESQLEATYRNSSARIVEGKVGPCNWNIVTLPKTLKIKSTLPLYPRMDGTEESKAAFKNTVPGERGLSAFRLDLLRSSTIIGSGLTSKVEIDVSRDQDGLKPEVEALNTQRT